MNRERVAGETEQEGGCFFRHEHRVRYQNQKGTFSWPVQHVWVRALSFRPRA